MELIQQNENSSAEEYFANPGQVQLGGARFNARFYKILVTF